MPYTQMIFCTRERKSAIDILIVSRSTKEGTSHYMFKLATVVRMENNISIIRILNTCNTT